ncbi:hypothetical protein TcBrA4_0075370 [Trypanosoma cruzi]|nr:hypothetical protein TcBrA4_0075370 [Trypanosoma cruzi]
MVNFIAILCLYFLCCFNTTSSNKLLTPAQEIRDDNLGCRHNEQGETGLCRYCCSYVLSELSARCSSCGSTFHSSCTTHLGRGVATGAQHRAHEALRLVPEAHYGVGLEGGLEKISDRWFECGWMYVIERSTGRCGIGSSARFEMSQKLMSKILDEGKELAEVMDEMTGETDVRSGQGAMGVLTAGYLNRAESYSHGLIFALAPFLSDHKYWE